VFEGILCVFFDPRLARSVEFVDECASTNFEPPYVVNKFLSINLRFYAVKEFNLFIETA
jgi:hypothetical protein